MTEASPEGATPPKKGSHLGPVGGRNVHAEPEDGTCCVQRGESESGERARVCVLDFVIDT